MKETKISPNAEARNVVDLEKDTNNVYLAAAIISKRANQIGQKMKEELSQKLAEFNADHDNLEEIHENREQIEISSQYEKMPKPTILATHEFVEGKVYFRLPSENEE